MKLLRRMARDVSADASFTDVREQSAEKHVGFAALFRDGRSRDTVAIWGAFFMCLLAVYAALAFGRVGAILSAFAGAAVITAGGASGYLLMLGIAMVIVLIALAVVQRHIPRRGAASAR
ncbi:putative phage tail protein [Paraburkholderia sp. CI3]